MQEKNRIS